MIFFISKNGRTPLLVAAEKGNKQIIQILLEKGNPNVDLPNKVSFSYVVIFDYLIDLVSFLFFFFFIFSLF